jgi:hypothetical protein
MSFASGNRNVPRHVIFAIILAGCCYGIEDVSKTLSDRTITMTFPQGDVLAWAACVMQSFREQHPDLDLTVSIDVTLPTLKTRVFNGSEQHANQIITNVTRHLIAELESPDTDSGVPTFDETPARLGVRRQHPKLRCEHILWSEVVSLFESAFNCNVSSKDSGMVIRLYPKELTLFEYRCGTNATQDVRETLSMMYARSNSITEGLIVRNPGFSGSFFVVATPKAHEFALRQLNELRTKFPCPEVAPSFQGGKTGIASETDVHLRKTDYCTATNAVALIEKIIERRCLTMTLWLKWGLSSNSVDAAERANLSEERFENDMRKWLADVAMYPEEAISLLKAELDKETECIESLKKSRVTMSYADYVERLTDEQRYRFLAHQYHYRAKLYSILVTKFFYDPSLSRSGSPRQRRDQ